MRKIKLLVAYDGTSYQGWQRQPGHPTVQGHLEAVLTQVYNEPIRVVGSGRTDAGVHAIGQVAHFDAPKIHSREDRLIRAVNSLLPETIAIKGAWLAPPDFHAMVSARRKTYIYRIWNHPVRSALWGRRALWVPEALDLVRLNSLSQVLVGFHDFKSFQTQGTPVKSTVRLIERCEWRAVSKSHPGPLIEMRIRGNGFLKQMVRNIVGTILHLERGHQDPAELQKILAACDRRAAKATAAAHGLYLHSVEYPPSLDNKCRKL